MLILVGTNCYHLMSRKQFSVKQPEFLIYHAATHLASALYWMCRRACVTKTIVHDRLGMNCLPSKKKNFDNNGERGGIKRVKS